MQNIAIRHWDFSTNTGELAAYLLHVDSEELVTTRLRGLESLIAAPVSLNAEVCEEGTIKFSYTLPQAAELLGIELTQATKRALHSESRELERRGMHFKVSCGFEGESFVVTVLLDVPMTETRERVKPERIKVAGIRICAMHSDARGLRKAGVPASRHFW